MPTLESPQNSTQIVPMEGVGFGFRDEGGSVYLAIMGVEGRAEKFMARRLGVPSGAEKRVLKSWRETESSSVVNS